MMQNVLGCFRCKVLASEIKEKKFKQGYQICPDCKGDLDYFWYNPTTSQFQACRPVTMSQINNTIKSYVVPLISG